MLLSDYKKEKLKCQKIKQLRNVQRFSTLNRLLCYACVFPLLHTMACLGQQKEFSLLDKVGSVGFIASTAGCLVLKRKEENITEVLEDYFRKER